MSSIITLHKNCSARLPQGCSQAEIQNSNSADGMVTIANRPDESMVDCDPPEDKPVNGNTKFKLKIGSGNNITLQNSGAVTLTVEI